MSHALVIVAILAWPNGQDGIMGDRDAELAFSRLGADIECDEAAPAHPVVSLSLMFRQEGVGEALPALSGPFHK
jgi:hypothetical protein